MKKVVVHIKNNKSIFLMLFILYAFTPCTVKTALFKTVDITYNKPILVSKTTLQQTSCQSTLITNQKNKATNQVQAVAATLPFVACSFTLKTLENSSVSAYISFGSISNSPPFYILFKRLKVYLM